jgi:hypothetical protein
MHRAARTTTSYVAALAIALQALWPLLVHARPKSAPLLVPVCTVEGVTHYLELPSVDAPLEKRAASHHEHCAYCMVGDDRIDAPRLVVPRCADSARFLSIPNFSVLVPEQSQASPAHPRAPPFIPSVDGNSDQQGRKHGEAIAIWRAGDIAGRAAAGRGVLRGGVLLDQH